MQIQCKFGLIQWEWGKCIYVYDKNDSRELKGFGHDSILWIGSQAEGILHSCREPSVAEYQNWHSLSHPQSYQKNQQK